MKKAKYKIEYGVTVYSVSATGRPLKKIKEIKFKNEKDYAYWLYKNDPLAINPVTM